MNWLQYFEHNKERRAEIPWQWFRAAGAAIWRPPGRQILTTGFALVAASALSVALLAGRALAIGRIEYGFLVWNLILAWAPLCFAGLAALIHRWKGCRSPMFLGCAILWLLFLPNAPYIVTDFIHLKPRPPAPLWLDIFIMMSFAGAGLALGFISLYLMHRIATRAFGWKVGWLLVGAALGLCGFGVYLGRFLRLNSWEPLTAPLRLLQKVADAGRDMATDFHSLSFVLITTAFLVGGYLLLFALTQFQNNARPVCALCGGETLRA